MYESHNFSGKFKTKNSPKTMFIDHFCLCQSTFFVLSAWIFIILNPFISSCWQWIHCFKTKKIKELFHPYDLNADTHYFQAASASPLEFPQSQIFEQISIWISILVLLKPLFLGLSFCPSPLALFLCSSINCDKTSKHFGVLSTKTKKFLDRCLNWTVHCAWYG